MKIEKVSLKCAVCGQESVQDVYYSTNTIGAERHLDLRCDFGSVNIPIQECPFCHYCDFDISEQSAVDEEFIKSQPYQEVLNSQVSDSVKKYLLSAMINERAGKQKSAALMYLGASWTFEDAEDEENTKLYRKKALNLLIDIAFRDEDGDILLQCVDLLRKNGEFEKAQEYLDMLTVDLNAQLEENKDNAQAQMVKKVMDFERNLILALDSKDYLMNDIDRKMEFVDFNALFTINSKFSNIECSMLAPIFYKMQDEYFAAACKYLETGERENLSFGNFTIEKLIKDYGLDEEDYLKALMVLNNLQQSGENAYLIYNPIVIE